MGIPNRDEIKGKAKQAAGEAKEKVADWTGDEKLESEAKKEHAKREAGEKIEEAGKRLKR